MTKHILIRKSFQKIQYMIVVSEKIGVFACCTSYKEAQHKVNHYRNERKYDRDGEGKYFRPLNNFELGLYFNHLL